MTGLGMVLLAAGVAAGLRIGLGYPRPDRTYDHLNRAEAAILDAVGEALFPAGGPVSPSAAEADCNAYIDRYMGWHSPMLRRLMHLLFFLIEHATIVFVPSWKRLTMLDPATRERYLSGWETSRFYVRRMVFQSLRSLMFMAYLQDRQVLDEIGFGRPAGCAEHSVEPSA